MGLEIIDGTGQGNSAKVTNRNEVLVRSVSLDTEADISLTDGRAFFVSHGAVADTLTVTDTGGYVMVLQNTSSTLDLVISNIFVGSDAAGDTFAIERNPTLGSLGNNTSVTPANLNFGSGLAAEATAYAWNETGDGITGITAGPELSTYITTGGTQVLPIDDTFVLSEDDIIAIRAHGTGSASEFAVSIRFHYVTRD